MYSKFDMELDLSSRPFILGKPNTHVMLYDRMDARKYDVIRFHSIQPSTDFFFYEHNNTTHRCFWHMNYKKHTLQ
jgi:hypothetical protein